MKFVFEAVSTNHSACMESHTPPPSTGELPSGSPTKEEKTMALLCHLLAFSGFVIPFPGASIVGPLILWAIKKDQMPFVDRQGKEVINFNITFGILAAICTLTFWLIIPIFLLVLIGIAWIVLTIMAAIQASEGKEYRYPFTLRLVS